jgi:hypothetical protein
VLQIIHRHHHARFGQFIRLRRLHGRFGLARLQRRGTQDREPQRRNDRQRHDHQNQRHPLPLLCLCFFHNQLFGG